LLPKHHTCAEQHQDDGGETIRFHGTPDIQFNRWLLDIGGLSRASIAKTGHLQEIQAFAVTIVRPGPCPAENQ
jgi:hypothetical protein